MKLTPEQSNFFRLVWPWRSKYKQLNKLSLISEPVTKTNHIILLWPHDPYHALILPIRDPMSQFLSDLQLELYNVSWSADVPEAVKALFVYFRGVVPEVFEDVVKRKTGKLKTGIPLSYEKTAV